jgi:hypothetical protein
MNAFVHEHQHSNRGHICEGRINIVHNIIACEMLEAHFPQLSSKTKNDGMA